MPTIKMDDLKRSMGIDPNIQLTSILTSNSEQSGKGKTTVGRVEGRTIEETKALIKTVLSEADDSMTRGEICKAIERKNTPHIRNILAQMVADGEIIEETGMAVSRMMVRYLYSLPR